MNIATVILAGGQGTRLLPLTQHRCKPAISFAGRYRLIDVPISNSIHAGFTQIFVLAQYLSSELQHHISQTYRFGMFQKGSIDVLTPQENEQGKSWFEGTADAVRKTLPTLLKSEAPSFLILSGDQLYHLDLDAMAAFAHKMQADIAIAATPVPRSHSERFGILGLDGQGYLKEFLEKPPLDADLQHFHLPQAASAEPDLLASMGIYLFRREALVSLLQETGNDFGHHLISKALKRWKLAAFVYDGYWDDIGTVESYYKANLLLTQQGGVNLYDEEKPIYTRPAFLPGPCIRNATIRDSILCDGSRIDAAEIDGCIIGMRSHVKKGTVIKKSVLMGNHLYLHGGRRDFSIGENCRIERAIIDENVHIGNNVRLTNESGRDYFDGDGVYIRDSIILVTAGARVQNHFTL